VFYGLGPRFEHYRQIAEGEIDMVITLCRNCLPSAREAPADDDMVCLMRKDHPLMSAPLTLEGYRRSKHLSSLEHFPGQGTILDNKLAEMGVSVHTAVRTQFLGTAPSILCRDRSNFSTGRLLAEDMATHHALAIAPFPGSVKPLRYNLVWHQRTHKNRAMVWFRGVVAEAARALAGPHAP